MSEFFLPEMGMAMRDSPSLITINDNKCTINMKGVMAHTCDPSPPEVEARRSGVQSHPQLLSGFENYLDGSRCSQKTKEQQTTLCSVRTSCLPGPHSWVAIAPGLEPRSPAFRWVLFSPHLIYCFKLLFQESEKRLVKPVAETWVCHPAKGVTFA